MTFSLPGFSMDARFCSGFLQTSLGDHPFAHLATSLKEISAITNHHLM
jgi:hypothetical protein